MRLLLIFFCLYSYHVSAQVKFVSSPFTQALQTARSNGKMVFLQFESVGCNQCNDVANKGFQDKEVSEKINEIFLCLKIDAKHPDRSEVAKAYNLNEEKEFGTLFISSNGTLLHKFSKTTSFAPEYSKQVDIALLRAGESFKMNELEEQYRKGDRSDDFVRVFLQERKVLNLPYDSLLDEYAERLPPELSKSIETLAFVAQMAPLIDSKAERIIKKDSALFTKAWFSMSLQKRVEINNAILTKSMAQAIKEKNKNYALRIASFARATTGDNYKVGIKVYDSQMLRFYDEVNDTTGFFSTAVLYYQRNFRHLNIDSIKRIDTLNVKAMVARAEANKGAGPNGATKGIVFAPVVQDYARELNRIAYKFYEKTNTSYLLVMATEWAEKALEFYKSPEIMDTYAKLLYKQNQPAKAIEMMQKAIAMQMERGYPTLNYENVLVKMKAGNSL
jgi:tetratricopeptide (TPR) repeat protein